MTTAPPSDTRPALAARAVPVPAAAAAPTPDLEPAPTADPSRSATADPSGSPTPHLAPAPSWPPQPRGPVSAAVLALLGRPAPRVATDGSSPGSYAAPAESLLAAVAGRPAAETLADDDLQLSYFLLAEVRFGLAGVDDRWDGHPLLAPTLRVLTEALEGALRATYDRAETPEEAAAPLPTLLQAIAGVPSPSGLSGYVSRHASSDQVRDLLVIRSPYQLKEADPQTLAIPRLRGRAKAALVEIQYDEYGAAHYPQAHQALFADTMAAFGLDPARYAYLDAVPARALAQVNAVTLFAANGWLRGALAGHFAVFELGSSVPMSWYARGLARLGYDDAAAAFFSVHVQADAVHEQIAMHDLCVGLVEEEPDLRRDILFGARVSAGLDDAVGSAVLAAWREGRSPLRQ